MVSLFQSRHAAPHHPPLAEYTALTHINTFIIDTSSGPASTLAHQMLKEMVQSNLKWPRGGTFISMCQLAPLSITVMLKDIVFWGERGRKMENGGGGSGGR